MGQSSVGDGGPAEDQGFEIRQRRQVRQLFVTEFGSLEAQVLLTDGPS